jgi:hypothetical protein
MVSIARPYPSYRRPALEESARKKLGSVSLEPARVGSLFIRWQDEWVSQHDLYHFEISWLPRIQMGHAQVSGIHGFCSPMFHPQPIVPEYEGSLDEGRVAIHEWLTRPSFYNTAKLGLWIIWFLSNGINPVAVMIRHINSLGLFRSQPSVMPSAYFQLCQPELFCGSMEDSSSNHQ